MTTIPMPVAGTANDVGRICAIYTRTSSAERLDQVFNSTDAQRLACSHFISSQVDEGWIEHDARYDDCGFSGGSTARPALQRLMGDLKRGLVSTVVVYKIDRLSRSLLDFMRLMDEFDRQGVSFVSVTQHFSTSNSMGRLTLNVLLSFAQFEREITSERIRDKFAAMRSKGMRTTGGRPFGYRIEEKRLVIDTTEAAIVKRIYASFIRLGSAKSIPNELNRSGLLNHRQEPFRIEFIRRLLNNRLYCGDLVHRGEARPGSHPRIISERTWDKAQTIRAPYVAQWHLRKPLKPAMLAGLLFGPTGALRHEGSVTKGRSYRYYGPPRRLRGGVQRSADRCYRAAELERFVLAVIDPEARLRHAFASENAGVDLVRSLVERIDIDSAISILLKTGRIILLAKAPSLSSSRLQKSLFISFSLASIDHQTNASALSREQ